MLRSSIVMKPVGFTVGHVHERSVRRETAIARVHLAGIAEVDVGPLLKVAMAHGAPAVGELGHCFDHAIIGRN
jgi:hypothetical protein